MHTEPCDAVWPDERAHLTLSELADRAGLSEAEVVELVGYGAFAPADAGATQWRFSVRSVTIARTARRLGEEHALEPHGVALVLAYLERIHDLEAELRAVRVLLPR